MIDSASLIAGWNMQRGWYPRGKPAYAPCMLSGTRVHMIGALYDGELDIVFGDKVNTQAVVDLLRRQLERRRKIMVILDNASWHHAKAVESLEDDEFAGRLVLVYLPSYTPELNSIELVWKAIRKAIANVAYESVAEIRRAVRNALLRRDVLITPIASYARDKSGPPPRHCTRPGREHVRAGSVLSLSSRFRAREDRAGVPRLRILSRQKRQSCRQAPLSTAVCIMPAQAVHFHGF